MRLAQSSKPSPAAMLCGCMLFVAAAQLAAPRAAAANAEQAKRLPGLETHLSAQELETLRTKGLSVEAHHCGCYDQPTPHFPYTLVIIKTPKRQLVARPEGQESAVSLTLLAVRDGERYCEIDADKPCFGAFATPCEFTDFRYGPVLADYFPTCKARGE
jgi:hypothetical protein